MTTPLPPGRIKRGQLLLSGRLDSREAHPLELAYAAQHVLTHASADADTWRRSPQDVALAELRASFPRALAVFGEPVCRAVTVRLPPSACRRCLASAYAKLDRRPLPGGDEATVYLIGLGCDRCRSWARSTRAQPTKTRPSGAHLASSASAPLARPSHERLKDWIVNTAAKDPILANAVRRLLGDRPVHPRLR